MSFLRYGRKSATLAATMLCTVAPVSHAQSMDSIPVAFVVGSRVRVRVQGDRRLIDGTLISAYDTLVVLRASGSDFQFNTGSLTSIDLSVARPGIVHKSLVAGALGGVAGVAIADNLRSNGTFLQSSKNRRRNASVVGFVVGAFVTAIATALLTPEQWEPLTRRNPREH